MAEGVMDSIKEDSSGTKPNNLSAALIKSRLRSFEIDLKCPAEGQPLDNNIPNNGQRVYFCHEDMHGTTQTTLRWFQKYLTVHTFNSHWMRGWYRDG